MSEKPNSTRRDFLTAAWPAPASDAADPEPRLVPPSDRSVSHLESYSKSAMACQFELMFNMQQYSQSAELALAAFQLIDEYEQQLTIYQDNSEISQLNRSAHGTFVEISPNVFELLSLANKVSEMTDGAFDITSGPLSELWGFSRRSGQVPDQKSIDATIKNVSYGFLELQPNRLRINRDDVQINLGGIGKGFALDAAAQIIVDEGLDDFVFHGGQSSVIGAGNNLNAAGETGWLIGLSHPVHPKRRIGQIQIKNQALGTSGTGRQGFFHQGRRYGHIIDPRTGYPTDHLLSTTVITQSAAVADALATAFFVMSLDQIETFCGQHREIAAVVVCGDKDNYRLAVETFNLDSGQLTLESV